jgi:hypothetical protein
MQSWYWIAWEFTLIWKHENTRVFSEKNGISSIKLINKNLEAIKINWYNAKTIS